MTEAEYIRLMDAILCVLGPYTDEPDFSDHPHLAELAKCYNDLYAKMPYDQAFNYPELLF